MWPLAIGQIVMGDSGAFTAFLNGASVNWDAYFAWLRPCFAPRIGPWRQT